MYSSWFIIDCYKIEKFSEETVHYLWRRRKKNIVISFLSTDRCTEITDYSRTLIIISSVGFEYYNIEKWMKWLLSDIFLKDLKFCVIFLTVFDISNPQAPYEINVSDIHIFISQSLNFNRLWKHRAEFVVHINKMTSKNYVILVIYHNI